MKAMHLNCLLALATFQSATAAITNKKVTWAIPTTPQEIIVSKGSKVTFEWAGNHNVYKSASKADFDSCTANGILAAPAANGGTFDTGALNTVGVHYYICSVGQHCTNGQKVAVHVVDRYVEWKVPTLPHEVTMYTGETIGFQWTGSSTVYEPATKPDYDSCKKSGGIQKAKNANGGVWTEVLSTSGMWYFIDEIGGNCEAGQKFMATVIGRSHGNSNTNPQPQPEPAQPNTPQPGNSNTKPQPQPESASSGRLSGVVNWLWILLPTMAPLVF